MKLVQVMDTCPTDETYVNMENVIAVQIMHCINGEDEKYRILLCTCDYTFTYGEYDSKLKAKQALNTLISDDKRINYGNFGKDY